MDKDLFRIQTLPHLMKMLRTWDSTMSMIPKGGETIWGGIDWSPEEGYSPCKRKLRDNINQISSHNDNQTIESKGKYVNYGRMIAFGKDAAQKHSSDLKRIDFRVMLIRTPTAPYFSFYKYFHAFFYLFQL